MSESIFSAIYADRRASVPRGLPLVVALQGQTDAGAAVAQLDAYMWEHCSPEEIIRFDPDELLDYRARRPLLTFEGDHFTDYAPEELLLTLAHDHLGAPFLLLSGFEPDYRWERFIDSVLLLVHEFEVSVTVWAHALPMPVPHTRPLGVTVSGSREDLVAELSVWKPTTRLSASASHVLEYRLHDLGEEVVGFALLVPHYLANAEYPAALVTALESIMAATGLLFETDEIREADRAFIAEVEEQVSDSGESRSMVETLEHRYDAYMAGRGVESPLLDELGDVPSADQIAHELERFLAEYQSGAGDPEVEGPENS